MGACRSKSKSHLIHLKGDHDLLASTFFSSSLNDVSALPQAIARPRGILQLLRKVFILIIVIPALLPQMCVASRYFGFLLCPVCSRRDTSAQLTFDEMTRNNSDGAHPLPGNPRIHRLPPTCLVVRLVVRFWLGQSRTSCLLAALPWDCCQQLRLTF